MKTVTFKIPTIVLVIAISFSLSTFAQYRTANDFKPGAEVAEIKLNSQLYSDPSDAKSQNFDNTLTGDQNTLQVKNRYVIIPNPSSGKSKLEVQLKTKDSQLLLFDLTGRIQLKVSIDPGQDKAEIDVSSLNKSIYILKVLAGETVVGVEKLVIN